MAIWLGHVSGFPLEERKRPRGEEELYIIAEIFDDHYGSSPALRNRFSNDSDSHNALGIKFFAHREGRGAYIY